MSDERIEAAMTREEMIAHAAYHIDKHCTGGTDEDWDAAEQIIKDLVDPLLDRSRDARSEDEGRSRCASIAAERTAEIVEAVRHMDDPVPLGVKFHHQASQVADFIEREFSPARVPQGEDLTAEDMVCACLDETGERRVELLERCLRCGALMRHDSVPQGEDHEERFCGWCGVMTDHHTAEHEDVKASRSSLPARSPQDEDHEGGIDWRDDAETLAQALEHVLLAETGAKRGDGHPAWKPLEEHERRMDTSGGYPPVQAARSPQDEDHEAAS